MDTKLNSCNAKELIVRNSFKKEYKLSCPVLDDNDIFQKSLMIASLESKWSAYLELSQRLGDLPAHRANLVNQLVQAMQHVKGFANLREVKDDQRWSGARNYLVGNNVGKRLLSIDLCKANYHSLKSLGDKFVLDTQDYQELVKRYTKESVFLESRMFRQLVFGLLKPRVQASLQRQMMYRIIDMVKSYDEDLQIVFLSNDEVIFEIQSDEDVLAIKKCLEHNIPPNFRLQEFHLEKIPNALDENWFIKCLKEGKRTITGVHVKYLFQVWNHLNNVTNEKKDFWWRERGRLCALLDAENF